MSRSGAGCLAFLALIAMVLIADAILAANCVRGTMFDFCEREPGR